jgi:GNAT superfamily N-acetyltransferase
MIRFATTDDIPQLIEGGKRMHAVTRFKHLDYNVEKVSRSFRDLIEKGAGKYLFIVAEDTDKRIVGALVGVMEQHLFSDEWVASIMHYDVLPEKRMGGYGLRLIKAFEQWAKNRKVSEIAFGINSGENPVLERFAERLGYKRVGANYALAVLKSASWN